MKPVSLGEKLAAMKARMQAAGEWIEESEPHVQCEQCGDFGVVRYDVPLEHPDFGKIFKCPNPQCPARLRMEHEVMLKRIKLARLPKLFASCTFESWQSNLTDAEKKGKWPAYLAAVQFVENEGHYVDLGALANDCELTLERDTDLRPKNSLVFYGPPGVGKTGLAAAIVNWLLARGEICLYATALNFIEDYKATYDRDSEYSTLEVLQKYKDAPVLFVDDFNVHAGGDDRLEKVEMVLRHRYYEQKPTILTCNINQEQFRAMWKDRSADAVIAMAHWIPVFGARLRKLNKPIGGG